MTTTHDFSSVSEGARGTSEEKPSSDAFELTQRRSADSADSVHSHDPALPAEIANPGEYRVYRRRWIGLVMLMVMNIVVSWGWLTYAPVSNLTAEWFRLDSESPVNWLSTVVLFAYAVATPYEILFCCGLEGGEGGSVADDETVVP